MRAPQVRGVDTGDLSRAGSTAARLGVATTWCAAGFWPLLAHGAGSAVSSNSLARLALSERLGVSVTPWVGALLLLVPICGGLLFVSAMATGRTAATVRGWSMAVGTFAVLFTTARATDGDIGRFGPAIWIALSGVLLCVLAIAAAAAARSMAGGRRDQ